MHRNDQYSSIHTNLGWLCVVRDTWITIHRSVPRLKEGSYCKRDVFIFCKNSLAVYLGQVMCIDRSIKRIFIVDNQETRNIHLVPPFSPTFAYESGFL